MSSAEAIFSFQKSAWERCKTLVAFQADSEFDDEISRGIELELSNSANLFAFTRLKDRSATIVVSRALFECVFRIFVKICASREGSAALIGSKWIYKTNRITSMVSRMRWCRVFRLGRLLRRDDILSPISAMMILADLETLCEPGFYGYVGIGKESIQESLAAMSARQLFLALACTRCAMTFVGMHELAHLALGHAQLLRVDLNKPNLFGARFPEISLAEPDLRGIFEFKPTNGPSRGRRSGFLRRMSGGWEPRLACQDDREPLYS